MVVNLTTTLIAGVTRTTRAAFAIYPVARAYGAVFIGMILAVFYRGSRQNAYNMLWAVVFAFATLNILALAARRADPGRRGLSFGEVLAVMVVLLSIFLLGWETLKARRKSFAMRRGGSPSPRRRRGNASTRPCNPSAALGPG